ncbi:MAG: LCP family protein [Bacillota bacterium]|nr:LCP family protein [Bacillota bacterium]
MKQKQRLTIFLIVITLFAAAVGWAWSVWVRVHDNPPPPVDYVPPDDIVEPEPDKNITNILLLGVDQIGNEPGRADSIIVMSINEDTDEVALISIPRDSRVEIPGHGMDKINHAMAYKGQISLMKSTVETLLGVKIDHYVYTNFTGFTRIVDILGGVTVNVERPMVHEAVYSPSINLSPGEQRLSGEQALGYVRFRGDAQRDFGRMERQQKFLKALANEVLQAKTVLKLPQLLEETARHLRTDMTIHELLDFARRANSINMDEVTAVVLPGRNVNINGIAYVDLDKDVLAETIRRYLRWEEDNSTNANK